MAACFLAQNSVLKKGFALFACAELDPGMYVLVGAMDYTCFSSEYASPCCMHTRTHGADA